MIRILGTDVLLIKNIQEVIQSYEPCDIVVPLAAVQELEGFKERKDEKGRKARETISFLDELRTYGRLCDGVKTRYGSTVKIETDCFDINDTDVPAGFDKRLLNNKALTVAKKMVDSGQDVVFVTGNVSERVVADCLGVRSESYGYAVDLDKVYTGWSEICIFDSEVQELHENRLIKTDRELIGNQYLFMKDSLGGVHLGRYDKKLRAITQLSNNLEAWGIKPVKNNVQQSFLMDALLNDNIKLVTTIGKAGTGKTLLALAAGLQKTINRKEYSRIIVSRAVIPVSRDIGFLPGPKEEKLTPWMGAIFDNLEFLSQDFSANKRDTKSTSAERVKSLMMAGPIELEALAYIRGRSISEQWIIIDEGQNISKEQMKTIISRAGKNTKIVITGDIEQIDNYRLDSSNNGLVHVINSFKGCEIYSHITLTKTERSALSELAGLLL
jgi:PhoH-like ATPase